MLSKCRAIVLTLFIFSFTRCLAQEVVVGLGASGVGITNQFSLQGNVGLKVRKQSYLFIETQHFFESPLLIGDLQTTESSWNYHVLFLYEMLQGYRWTPYVLGGIGASLTTLRYTHPTTQELSTFAMDRFGLVYGTGVELDLDFLKPFSELRYQTGNLNWLLTIGTKIAF